VHFTVCICTRNRGDSIDATLQSIREQYHSDFDVLVLDQSADDRTEKAAAPYVRQDSRFAYIRVRSVGRSAALNHGIARATGPILACTDDDCVADPSWLATFDRYFTAEQDVGLISAPVLAAPYDPADGFIPTAPILRNLRIDSPWVFFRDRGIGANQAYRLAALRRAGPFDSLLGAGSTFPSGEDTDMAYRFLALGVPILNIAEARVLHYGFRPQAQIEHHMQMVAYGLGAMYAKHLRAGDPAILVTFLNLYVRALVGAAAAAVVGRLPAPLRGRLAMSHPAAIREVRRRMATLPPAKFMTTGLVHSFRYAIDRRLRVYTMSLDNAK
jgi:glycosyltransferase involved in cell wall biosynthesis